MYSSKAIAAFLKGMTFSDYQSDLKTRSATERQLQNLTEAAFRLGEDAQRLCLNLDWRAVRGLGNVLRHEYDEIQDEVIWQAIRERLPLLQESVESALARLPNDSQAAYE